MDSRFLGNEPVGLATRTGTAEVAASAVRN